jgi:acetyl esterase/lipase
LKTTIEFGNHDGVALITDITVPDGPGPFPALIGVHGGGWQQGSRDIYRHWGPFLVARGYVLMAIDYRTSAPGRKSYPDAVHDVRAAVQFLKGEATGYKVDPARIALIGDSAGGHLATLVALAGDHPTFAGAYPDDKHANQSTRVKCAVGVYGIYDMARQWNSDQVSRPRNQITEQFLGCAPMDDRQIYFDASPLSYTTMANNSTAFLLTYGTEDDIVDRAQSDDFLLALKQAKFWARNAVIQGWGHYWMGTNPEDPATGAALFAPRLLRFLEDML